MLTSRPAYRQRTQKALCLHTQDTHAVCKKLDFTQFEHSVLVYCWKMVLKCAFPGCLNRQKPKSVRKSALPTQRHKSISFHSFPVNDPERLKLWLVAVHQDVDLPIRYVKQMMLCSEHFSPDDFRPGQGQIRRHLKSTAVPNLSLLKTEGTPGPSQHSQDVQSEDKFKLSQDQQSERPAQDPLSAGALHPNQDPQSADPPLHCHLSQLTYKLENTEELFSAADLARVPQSTPLKSHHTSTRIAQDLFGSKLLLVLSSPETAEQHSRQSTLGTYYALPVVKSDHSDEPTHTENLSEQFSLDVSMLSLDPPSDKKDLSFVPLNSTSTSTPKTEVVVNNKVKERKWMVNESNLMELFSRCHQCGASVIDTKKTTVGSLIRVQWECSSGHKGTWSSCDEA